MDTQLQGITDLILITPIRAGFVESFEPISYVGRLRAVLKTLNALRLASRESTDPPSPFTDVVSRFRIVHSFRWTVIDPTPGTDEPARLLLHVCFDGGWDSYMRVIWRDLGTMLDLILCHSVDYKLSRDVSYEQYSAWVRANEVPAGFLFIESGRTVSDQDYLARLELQERLDAKSDALAAARLSTPLPGWSEALPADPPHATAMAVRGLNAIGALYALDRYFSVMSSHGDGWCLLRAARDILFEMVRLNTAQLFGPTHPVRQALWAPLAWFENVPPTPKLQPREFNFDPLDVQGGILSSYATVASGALLLMQVVNPAQALQWLATAPVSSEADTISGERPPQDGYLNVALSLAGLRALGAGEDQLAAFSQPFREGMEQRAGVLGDLRHNHPKSWKLPQQNWPPSPTAGETHTIDMGSVHLLVQLRHDMYGVDSLEAQIKQIAATPGLRLLSLQRLRRQGGPDGQTRESFGFVDGISQPMAAAAPVGSDWSDEVPRGDLLLGYPTSRDAVAVPEQASPLLDNGSYLVVRKLKQNVESFQQLLDENAGRLGLNAELLAAKLMGRWRDGRPLAHPVAATNDFNYKGDPDGSKCPFHAHIRRANPREPQSLPRIVRRGMSYGQPGDADRGLVFMAYNTNLAEQFETIQRWISGGNSSGGYSGQSDPYLGVAVAGEERVFRCEVDGKAVDIRLGDKPLVELQWGAYFFVPSIPALRKLGQLLRPMPPAPPQFKVPSAHDFEAWQFWLEDHDTTDTAWAWVRSQGGVVASPYGVLVGDAPHVMEVLRNPDSKFSVSGYGERMSSSIGLGYLGMDGKQHDTHAPTINQAIEVISEREGFDSAYAYASGLIKTLRDESRALGLPEATLDFEFLGMVVLEKLCTQWFGLPDKQAMWGMEYRKPSEPQRPRCPRDFIPVARHVFGAHPSKIALCAGQDAGKALDGATADWLASKPDLSKWPLSQAIVKAMEPFEKTEPGVCARTLAGIMLGFPPTVFGNLVTGLAVLAAQHVLWDLQLAWKPVKDAKQRFAEAGQLLRPALVGELMAKPVPSMVWRKAAVDCTLGGVSIKQGEVVIVGLGSATQSLPPEQAAEGHFIAFGGARRDPAGAPMHACPGYAMSMGVLQGVLAAVLEAGTLQASPSPTVLTMPL
jgi:Dyp-type peroxidase family